MKNLYISILTFLLFLSCENKIKEKRDIKPKKYKRQKIRYDLGKNTYQDVEIYISRKNDTIGFETKTYQDNKLDSSRSNFYSIDLYKVVDKKTLKVDSINGSLKYHFDSIKEGRLKNFWFVVNGKKENKIFRDSNNFKNKKIEFSFKHDNDTLMGMIYAQHIRDTIVNGEEKFRLREIIIPVDNYLETDNPFVDFKL